jgi:TP901-1 family phage major tail protein
MAVVRGLDILILVESTTTPDTYVTVGGQRGATLSENTETIETTHKQTGGYKTFLPSFAEWTISADGVYISDDTAYQMVVDAMRNKTIVKVRWQENGTAIVEGDAIITSRELEGAYDSEATYSLELQGTGAITEVPETP